MIVRFKDGRKFEGVMALLHDQVSGWYMKYIEVNIVDGKHVRKQAQMAVQLDWILGIVDGHVEAVYPF